MTAPLVTETLDAAILQAIDDGHHRSQAIVYMLHVRGVLARDSNPPGWRMVDRRLQAMRRCGVIEFSVAEGWKRREHAR